MRAGQYHKTFDQIPQYQYCNNTVGLTVSAFTNYFLNRFLIIISDVDLMTASVMEQHDGVLFIKRP